MAKKPDLEKAYALNSADDTRALYADWAETYDTGFAAEMGYRLHIEVARAYADRHIDGAVIDLGAGTGLVGEALYELGIAPVDGTDLSAEMLDRARAKGVYRNLFEGDLLWRLPVADQEYSGAVSAGTFTNGHVGPEALEEVLRVVRPGGWVVISVNTQHWDAKGFDEALLALMPELDAIHKPQVQIYDETAKGAHAKDTAILLTLRKRG